MSNDFGIRDLLGTIPSSKPGALLIVFAGAARIPIERGTETKDKITESSAKRIRRKKNRKKVSDDSPFEST